jgi:uncharacterized protein
MHQHTNSLINETSPYLLQHAHNPVNWLPWGEKALKLAKTEDKPILVSIGYAACHWCHVMEHESFENEDIASLMNEFFVCIKVDREERPDVDNVYMDAIHAMGLHGGWPLNVFLMPDGKPFYGGTYFPPQNWAKVLININEAFKNHRAKIADSAEKFTEVISKSEIAKYNLTNSNTPFTEKNSILAFLSLQNSFDEINGGVGSAPKFPMPSIYRFLLHYYYVTNDENALKQVELTLQKMARGGIYDQLGGGFARYSVDEKWLVPHFEKMLYDNGQLVTLYSEAFQVTKNEEYKQVVYDTIAFVKRELMHENGGFYSSLDADSEGVEGKFYVWKYEELKALLGDKIVALAAYYNISEHGNWEETIILERNTFSSETESKLKTIKQQLFEVRTQRIRPGTDDKILTSWNALMLKGLIDAYRAFAEPDFLEMALKNAEFLHQHLYLDKTLYRNHKNGKTTLKAYLEDYATLVEALTHLYQVTFDTKWLTWAKELTEYTLTHFYDKNEGFFFYTDENGEELIARKKEIFDNVISSSNSIMATNLFYLGQILEEKHFSDLAKDMMERVNHLVVKEPRYLANWAWLYMAYIKPTFEIALVGNEVEDFRKEIDKKYIPNKVIVAKADLPLLQNRTAIDGKTTAYVCVNKACKLPVNSVEEVLEQIN